MTIKIFIGNLGDDVEVDDLRDLFEKYGDVAECDVLKNYGFVHMTSKSDADTAISNLNGHNIKGHRMRVELSTGKRGNLRGDRRGPDRGERMRPYPPGPPRRLPPPPPPPHPLDYDRYDPYYRYAYPERDPYYRLHPADRYLPPPRLPPAERYALARERLLPEERAAYALPDPRDRLLVRERLPPPYPEEAAYERLRAVERVPPPADPYYRERSPPARPPPEYYDRKPPLMRNPAAVPEPSGARPVAAAYPPANGYDYYRRPVAAPERPAYAAPAAVSGQDYYAPPPRAPAGYNRPVGRPAGPPPVGSGGYGGHPPQGQPPSKSYDSQAMLQTKPIFF